MKKFNNGDRVLTNTHAVHQKTQKSLSGLNGTVVNNDDYPWNIHVELDTMLGPVGFSEFELTHINPQNEQTDHTIQEPISR